MRVWVFEDNLIWSARLQQSLRALGHEAATLAEVPPDETSDAAIINLGSQKLPATELAERLRARGIYTIGHAGHKEKELLELGRAAGCDRVVTNSELTFKLGALLAEATRG